jgi:alpha-tubulin suppressor-like RCC1 family protein
MKQFIRKLTIAAGCAHTIGLKLDGTVVAVGDNEYGQCDVGGWCGIQLPGN